MSAENNGELVITGDEIMIVPEEVHRAAVLITRARENTWTPPKLTQADMIDENKKRLDRRRQKEFEKRMSKMTKMKGL